MWFFTSDPHYWHKRICEFANRPFDSVEQMNEILIKNWNSVVGENDDVIIVGDFSFGNADQTESILRRLVGRKYLVKGNHDETNNTLSPQCIKYFEWVKDYHEMEIADTDRASGKRTLVICHYPLLTWNGGHKIDKKGQAKSYMIHGHCHSSIDYINKNTTREDIGVDNPKANYTPFSEHQIKQLMKNRSYVVLDHHGSHKK